MMMHGNIEAAAGAVSRNPATSELIATYPFLKPADVENTLARNAAAAMEWRATPMDERVGCYQRLASPLRDTSEVLALTATNEMGKTIKEARAEIEKCASALDWLAGHGPAMLADEVVESDGLDRIHVLFLGVTPWNFPFWQAMRAAGPIMLSGNGFLLKHASNVMGCALARQAACEASGFPKDLFGILNVSTDVVADVMRDPRIAAVTVTGGKRAGSAVASVAGSELKRSLLEPGGADAFIVLADADIDKAVDAGIEARFQNAGQVCLAAKRFILEKPIADEFTQKYVNAAAKLRAGDPLDEATTVGPIARHDLQEGVHDQVVRSIARGAKPLLGGKKIEGPGFFYEPTVLAGAEPGMSVFDEEVFGPVAAMTIADDVEHAIGLANMSEYGLSGNLWTTDTKKANEIAGRLETGAFS